MKTFGMYVGKFLIFIAICVVLGLGKFMIRNASAQGLESDYLMKKAKATIGIETFRSMKGCSTHTHAQSAQALTKALKERVTVKDLQEGIAIAKRDPEMTSALAAYDNMARSVGSDVCTLSEKTLNRMASEINAFAK